MDAHQMEKRRRLNKRILKIAGGVLGAIVLIAIIASLSGGSGSEPSKAAASSPAAKTHESTHKPSSKANQTHESKPTHQSKPDRVKLAHKVESKLDIKGMGFPCNWKTETRGDDAIVYTASCTQHKILLATGDGEFGSGIKVWVDNMDEQASAGKAYGWVLVKKHYAVMSPDHGTVNRMYDLLGATGTVRELGK